MGEQRLLHHCCQECTSKGREQRVGGQQLECIFYIKYNSKAFFEINTLFPLSTQRPHFLGDCLAPDCSYAVQQEGNSVYLCAFLAHPRYLGKMHLMPQKIVWRDFLSLRFQYMSNIGDPIVNVRVNTG